MTRRDSPVDSGADSKPRAPFSTRRVGRLVVGGLLMGVANLIPGVSGGTMILAVGIYNEFIESVAEITALRFRFRTLAFLGIVGSSAAIAVVSLSGVILYLLFHYSSSMFALFIGLTLGGTPLLYRSVRPVGGRCIVAVVAGIALMAGIAALKTGTTIPHNMAVDLCSGVAGAVTMILPGISGSYILLVLGQYDRVIGAIDDLRQMNLASLGVLVPFGLGAAGGLAVLSNALKHLLHRYEKITIGFLLGMLLGSVLGLWPFERQPTEKSLEKRSLDELVHFADRHGIALADPLDHEACVAQIQTDWQNGRTVSIPPREKAVAAGFLVLGLAITTLLGRLSPAEPQSSLSVDTS